MSETNRTKAEVEVDLHRLAADIARFAARLGAPHEPAVVTRTLETFEIGFRNCPIELRTTSAKPGKPESEVSFRYIDPRGSHDPHRIAVDAGLLAIGDRPVDRLVPELQERLPIFGYGVDATAAAGLEKIWPFFDRSYPLGDIVATIRALPASVERSQAWLLRHGLTRVATIAADYRHASTNLYFMADPQTLTPARIAAMLAEIGVSAPEPESLQYSARAGIVAVSYVWDSDVAERVCFYVLAPTPDRARIPDDPSLRAAATDAPTLAESRMFVIGYSFGPRGAYVKLEIDYTGTSVPLLQRWLDRHGKQRGAAAVDVERGER